MTPGPILELFRGYYGTKLVLAAIELDLFAVLAGDPVSTADACTRLGIDTRGAGDFLDGLAALGLLVKTPDERYRVSEVSARFLDSRAPQFLGYMLRLRTIAWDRLTPALRSGKTWREAPVIERADEIAKTSRSEGAWRSYLSAMDSMNTVIAQDLAKCLDWSRYSSVVDVGGARGNLVAELVGAHPHLRAGCFDLPPVAPLFDEHMSDRGATGRVRFHAGDFFADPLPPADVFVFGHVLHNWSTPQRLTLLRKAFDALTPGGAVLVYDMMADGTHRTAVSTPLESLQMRLVGPGSEYPVRLCCEWLTSCGFSASRTVAVGDVDTVVIAEKPAG